MVPSRRQSSSSNFHDGGAARLRATAPHRRVSPCWQTTLGGAAWWPTTLLPFGSQSTTPLSASAWPASVPGEGLDPRDAAVLPLRRTCATIVASTTAAAPLPTFRDALRHKDVGRCSPTHGNGRRSVVGTSATMWPYKALPSQPAHRLRRWLPHRRPPQQKQQLQAPPYFVLPPHEPIPGAPSSPRIHVDTLVGMYGAFINPPSLRKQWLGQAFVCRHNQTTSQTTSPPSPPTSSSLGGERRAYLLTPRLGIRCTPPP